MTTVQSGRREEAGDRERLAAEAVRAAEDVAERLADPERVAAVAGRDGNREPVYGAPVWEPTTLSHGHPGIALLHAELSAVDGGWAEVAHRHVRAAAERLSSSPSVGLFGGPAAVLAATQACAHRVPGSYVKLRRRLADWLARDQTERLAAASARREAGEVGVGWHDYDVINGLSGTGRLLLEAADDPVERGPDTEAALEGTLRHLVRITEPIRHGGRELPGWWVPNGRQPVEQDRRDYPDGDFNLGLAHGIPGPLALFAAALDRGREVPGQREAMRRIAEWLLSWRLEDGAGAYWPCRVSLEEQCSPERPGTAFTRTAWCYGAPGVASALYRAGLAAGVPGWCTAATDALRSALERDERLWRLEGTTVCHGLAGFLHVLWRVGSRSGDPVLLEGAARLARDVLGRQDGAAAFLFPHLVPDSPEGWRDESASVRPLDIAGVLEGAAGTACALLSFARQGEADPVWDRCLALS
ncbi:lanthionine synthetase C family protein [Nocardiopsis sp. CNT-189]|uniref:lanthionine synthetase C family protein n=1 Tax=Nocardiopsis oceanisediminis TaxID=2816862 RepID=UPI003B30598C